MNGPMDETTRKELLTTSFQQRFERAPSMFVQAPGRVDLIGSHTDYNQGFVLTQAIDRSTWLAARSRADGKIRVASLNVDGEATFSLDDIHFDHEVHWSNYVRGVADEFQKGGYQLCGWDGLVHSTIPFASGLSSSAALEVATAVTLESLTDWQIDPVEMARLCQRAENEFVGVNSGILDQYSCLMGQEDHLLLFDARAVKSELISIDDEVEVVICDTKSERELANSEYEARREQCEQGVAILREHYPEIKALRDVSRAQLDEHRQQLPEVVYQRCRFIIEENQRVLDCAQAVAEQDHELAGQLMNESFAGARDLYEIVSPEMSGMHAAIMQSAGCYGARGAGAGFGGVLVALVEAGMVEDFGASVRQGYRAETGIEAEVYPVQAASGAGVALRLN